MSAKEGNESLKSVKSRFSGDLGPKRAISDQIGSKSGPNQVCAEVFGGGRGEWGRRLWDGPVGPPKVLSVKAQKEWKRALSRKNC